MDRIARLLPGRRSRIAAVVGTVAVVLVVGVATATILAPDPIAAPVATSPTPGASASASAVPTPSPASPVATTSIAAATPQPTATPSPTPVPAAHTVTAGVIQAVVADVRVRQSADVDATVVATLSAGQQARTTASTVSAGGYTWTDIVLQPSGIRGWAAIADRGGTDPWLASVGDGPLVVTTGDISALVSPAIGLGGHSELVDPETGSRERLTRGIAVTDLAVAPDGSAGRGRGQRPLDCENPARHRHQAGVGSERWHRDLRRRPRSKLQP